jgi:hypothetical protein
VSRPNLVCRAAHTRLSDFFLAIKYSHRSSVHEYHSIEGTNGELRASTEIDSGYTSNFPLAASKGE